jgi:hypothetical protein
MESIDTAATLEKEGFVALVLMRVKTRFGKTYYDAGISIWGPDGLSVDHRKKYSWEHLQKELRRCQYCNKKDVETVRVGFAGRCCKTCLPELRKKIETPGWYD